MGSDPISAFVFVTIDAMLNFDGDIDANTEITGEQRIKIPSCSCERDVVSGQCKRLLKLFS